MKQRTIFLLLALTAITLAAYPATDTIPPVQMKYAADYQTALQLSKQSKKPIFVNCYADWAIPCRGMNQAVFNNKAFADWADKNFVNLLVDVTQTAEGQAFAKKHKVETFAHYLVLDGDGNVIHRIVGGRPLPDFQNTLARALNPKTRLKEQTEAYGKGNRKLPFLREYLLTLYGADQDYNNVETEFLKKLPRNDRTKKENWEIITRQANSLNSPVFVEIEQNKDKFIAANSEQKVLDFLGNKYTSKFVEWGTAPKPCSPDSVTQLYERVKKSGIAPDNEVHTYYQAALFRCQKKYKALINLLQEKQNVLTDRVVEMYDYALLDQTGMSPEDKELVTAYLTRQATRPDKQNLQVYKRILKKITESDAGIRFESGTLAETLLKAKETGKLIFLDAYTSWCGPCKMMSEQVFTTKEAGDFFNSNCLNLKIDMEKGEGIEIAKRYAVEAFPTMLLLNSAGEMVHKVLGGMNKEELIANFKRGMSENTSYKGVKARYAAGERDTEFMADFLLTMSIAGEMPEEISTTRDAKTNRKTTLDKYEVIGKFLTGLTTEQAVKPNAWNLFSRQQTSVSDALFQTLLKNKKTFADKVGSEAVDKKIEQTIYRSIISEYSQKPATAEKWSETAAALPHFNGKSANFLNLMYKITTGYRNKDYAGVLSTFNNEVSAENNPSFRKNLDALIFYVFQDADKATRQKAAEYVAKTKAATTLNQEMYETLLQELAK